VIALRTPYGVFDLGPDTQITLVEKNNALDWDNDFNLERSYPVDLPWTENNARIWKLADTPESTDEELKLPCDLELDGNTEFRGTVYLLGTIEGARYTISLSYDRELLDPQTLISEIDYGDLSTYDAENEMHVWDDDVDSIVNGTVDTVPYALPQGKHLHFSYEYFNHWNTALQEYYPGRYFIPMFYLGYVLEKIAAQWNLQHSGSFKTDPELKKLVVYNAYVRYGAVYVTTTNNIMSFASLEMKYHLPPITIGALMGMLRKRFAAGVDIDLKTGRLHVYSLRDAMAPGEYVDVTAYIKQHQYQEIKPAEEAPVLVQNFDEHDELKQYIKTDAPVNLKGTVATEGALFALTGMVAGDIYLVTETDYYWVYNNSTWIQHQYRYFNHRLGAGKEIVDDSSSVITTLQLDSLNGEYLKTTEADYGKANFENNTIDYSLRLLLYHGLQPSYGILPQQYPYGGIDNKDSNGAVIGDLELRDDGAYGQYERYKQYRILAASSAKHPRIVLKDCPHIVSELQPHKAIMVHSQKYLWTEKTRTYDINGLMEVELRTIKL
jgi:hypothetical protein